jgi:hypothetical protein
MRERDKREKKEEKRRGREGEREVAIDLKPCTRTHALSGSTKQKS